jgi:hypothetical protein
MPEPFKEAAFEKAFINGTGPLAGRFCMLPIAEPFGPRVTDPPRNFWMRPHWRFKQHLPGRRPRPGRLFGEFPEPQAQKRDNGRLLGTHPLDLLRQIDASFFG